MQEKTNPIGKADFCSIKQKALECFFFCSKKEAIIYPHLRIVKICLVETKQTFGFIISNCICGSEICSTPLFPFFLLTRSICFYFKCIELSIEIGLIEFQFDAIFAIFLLIRFLESHGGPAFVVVPVKWVVWCLTS